MPSNTKKAPTQRGNDRVRGQLLEAAAKTCSAAGIEAAGLVIVAAVERGEVTERQGQNIMKLVAAGHLIRTVPLSRPIQDERGHWSGEVRHLADGRWSALRYGPEFVTGGIIVADEDTAERYVRTGLVEGSA